jgi:hypothetical protein
MFLAAQRGMSTRKFDRPPHSRTQRVPEAALTLVVAFVHHKMRFYSAELSRSVKTEGANTLTLLTGAKRVEHKKHKNCS